MCGFRILHWGPLIALSIIASITSSTVYCHIEWWPLKTLGAWINFGVFLLWNTLTLYNFFLAAFIGPGHVPLGWKPKKEEDAAYLQYCQICEGYKAPRSHHCRKCQRCVMKMDHHCPWINNCVGHKNHANFIAFLFFAPCGCIHAVTVLAPALYRSINRHYYMFYGTGTEPIVNLGVGGLICSMLSIGLAVGVTLAVGGLLVIQMLSVIRNETGIENWIKNKAEYREAEEGQKTFVYPYNLGRWNNIKMVLYFGKRPELDGIWWPVRTGCGQYDLTMEQIRQKEQKRCHSVVYTASQRYNGAKCPCGFGLRVCCCPPCMDEQRVSLEPGDQILVSRFKKHWLYGDKIYNNTAHLHPDKKPVKRERGWFPRKCGMRESAVATRQPMWGPEGDWPISTNHNSPSHHANNSMGHPMHHTSTTRGIHGPHRRVIPGSQAGDGGEIPGLSNSGDNSASTNNRPGQGNKKVA